MAAPTPRTLTPLQRVEARMLELLDSPRWLDRVVRDHLATGGRRSRARLALAASEALGVPTDEAVHLAAACELLHNATLVHDDLQDGDRVRRGQPTVWVAHGPAQAINAGDLLLMLPQSALDGLQDEARAFRVGQAISRRAVDCVHGQALELRLAATQHFDAELYERAVRGKSGELLALPVEGAALLAGRGRFEARELAAPFLEVGLLYQLVDDLVDLYGDKGRGVAGNDLREGKPSALVIEHLARRPQDEMRLRRLLACPREEVGDEEVLWARAAFLDSGAALAVLARARALAEELVHPGHELHPLLEAFVGLCLAPTNSLEISG